jgi:hypothetical protein
MPDKGKNAPLYRILYSGAGGCTDLAPTRPRVAGAAFGTGGQLAFDGLGP